VKLPAALTPLTIIVEQSQRALLYRDGKLFRWLGPGKLRLLPLLHSYRVELIGEDEPARPWTAELARLVPPNEAIDVMVPPASLAVLELNGQALSFLEAGRHLVWTRGRELQVQLYDMRAFSAELPEHHLSLLPELFVRQFLVRDHELLVLSINGRRHSTLLPGRHRLWTYDKTIAFELFDTREGASPLEREVESVLPPESFEAFELGEDQLAVLWLDGRPHARLNPGRYAIWKRRRASAVSYPCAPLQSSIPPTAWPLFSAPELLVAVVEAYESGVLLVDGRIHDVLEPGRYAFHRQQHAVELRKLDLRDTEFQIVGQELLTADKVSLRLSLIVKYRISDARRCVERVAVLRDAIYSEAQIAARRHIGQLSIDQLLENRDDSATALEQQVADACRDWGVEVFRVELKDIVLPGEMKTLLNQVIEAEKRAAAQLILRREETAATRSLANTAKVLENNPMLARLKELESLKEVAAKVERLTVVLGGEELRRVCRLDES
jgi:regulator of protease activity HflC (stomatin/prohibitin superfamily)